MFGGKSRELVRLKATNMLSFWELYVCVLLLLLLSNSLDYLVNLCLITIVKPCLELTFN